MPPSALVPKSGSLEEGDRSVLGDSAYSYGAVPVVEDVLANDSVLIEQPLQARVRDYSPLKVLKACTDVPCGDLLGDRLRFERRVDRKVDVAVCSGPAVVSLQADVRLTIEHDQRASVSNRLECEVPSWTGDLADPDDVVAGESHGTLPLGARSCRVAGGYARPDLPPPARVCR